MKKNFLFSLAILSILAFLGASAFRSRNVDIGLESVGYMREKGVTFKFLVSGDVRKNDLKGGVLTGNQRIGLHCNYRGDPTPLVVVCTAAKGTAKLAGQPAIVSVGGHSFFFTIPARTTPRD